MAVPGIANIDNVDNDRSFRAINGFIFHQPLPLRGFLTILLCYCDLLASGNNYSVIHLTYSDYEFHF
jgi:hypothetical protein